MPKDKVYNKNEIHRNKKYYFEIVYVQDFRLAVQCDSRFSKANHHNYSVFTVLGSFTLSLSYINH